jgi:uncharacterized protein (DUF4415 family)
MKKSSTARTSRTDWKRIDSMRDEDIDFSDIPELTAEDFRRSVVDGRRVGVKERVTLRVDADVLDQFRARGSMPRGTLCCRRSFSFNEAAAHRRRSPGRKTDEP